MTCLVVYDIDDNKIRGKLARFLSRQGLRLQKSVFAVEVERHVFKRFTDKIELLTAGQGKVAIFRLCALCQQNAIKLHEDDQHFYIY